MNNFGNLTDQNLHAKVATISSYLIEDYAQYGVTEAQMEALSALNESFAADLEIVMTTEDARVGAVAAKNAKRQEVLDSIREVSRTVYADPAVTNELLGKAGFALRPTYGTKTTPKTVTSLNSTAFSNGTVKLKWSRSGNSKTALFTIWARSYEGEYVQVATTNRVSLTLSGFAPGVYKQFMVTAHVNNQSSAPSPETAIYGSGGSGEVNLQIAA